MTGGRVIEVGDHLPLLTKTVYQRALDRIHFREDSIHNDDYTRSQGYPGALVSAYVLAGYMSEPLVHLFGALWFTAGSYALTFLSPGVQQGDRVTIGGRVTSRERTDEGRSRLTVGAWMAKKGRKDVVDSAS